MDVAEREIGVDRPTRELYLVAPFEHVARCADRCSWPLRRG